ncbi:anti-phage dCTP deaminase [Nitrobacteraceae bacterium UC4446_H13]
MPDSIQKIKQPELVFGFVCPIGADMMPSIQSFRRYFERRQYEVIEIKVTDIFNVLQKYLVPEKPLDKSNLYRRYDTYIAYGNQIRAKFGDAALAALGIRRIMEKRVKRDQSREPYSRTVYLVHQFKRKEEIDLLRSVYGRLFFQISIYSRRGARVDYLSRKFANSDHVTGALKYRDSAETLVKNDENEVGKIHGQRVAKIFHDADFIVNVDVDPNVDNQIERFCELLFGSNKISPTHREYGLFLAKAAALRSLDLSRQVGAAIFSKAGEIISLGSNEVPKADGGTYWTDDAHDDRDFRRQYDSNFARKKEILTELIKIIAPSANTEELINRPEVRDSQLMDALEYGRMVHAEMSALSDAARLGRSVIEGTLYCTTFPCHMCAKHIVAAGIKSVVFLEPYPKSLAADLHADSIRIEGNDRGRYQTFPAVDFEHFFGVTPRRYREIFERGSRKDEKDGSFIEYQTGDPLPIMDVKFPFYIQLEQHLTEDTFEAFKQIAGEPDLTTI